MGCRRTSMRIDIAARGRCWDPLYGRTELSHFEYALLSTPEVQRLRYIRMCNINSMLVTGASEISRFEHSLGVLRLVQEWIDAHQDRIPEPMLKRFAPQRSCTICKRGPSVIHSSTFLKITKFEVISHTRTFPMAGKRRTIKTCR